MCLLQCGRGTKSQASSFWACISSSVASAALAWDRFTLMDFYRLLPFDHEVHVLMPKDLKMGLWSFLNFLTVLPLSHDIMTSWYHGFPLTLVKHSPSHPSFFLFINSEENLSFSHDKFIFGKQILDFLIKNLGPSRQTLILFSNSWYIMGYICNFNYTLCLEQWGKLFFFFYFWKTNSSWCHSYKSWEIPFLCLNCYYDYDAVSSQLKWKGY